jgi:hypothetical protein
MDDSPELMPLMMCPKVGVGHSAICRETDTTPKADSGASLDWKANARGTE